MADQKFRNAIQAGHTIGNYSVEKVLGQGGFGITYLGRDDKLDRFIAIKEFFPTEFVKREADSTVVPQSQEDEDTFKWGLERFLNEGKTLAKFKHPNIVRVTEFLETNNTAYIIMEYEQGRDLSVILKEKKTLPPEEILKIFFPLLDGLLLVHNAGIVHRDIKPANIFIREDGSPVLIDFGSAREGMASRTKSLTTLVSPGYAPFEQYNADGQNKQGPWTDIYALGASMYKALFGRSPLDAVSRAEERVAGREDPYMTATSLGEGHYPEYLLGAIDKALEFLPADRPQNLRQWLEILRGNETAYEQHANEAETIKIAESSVTRTTKIAGEQIAQPEKSEEDNLKLAITKFLIIGLFSFWSYTSYTLCGLLFKNSTSLKYAVIKEHTKYLYSGFYALSFLLVLSWVVPNVFAGYVIGEGYILKMILVTALIFYANTLSFMLWYMKTLKGIDKHLLDTRISRNELPEEVIKTAKNNLVSKWEKIDNNSALFLIISLPIIFSPYVCAKIFYGGASQYIIIALPVLVMLLGGIFHVWGTRLLINTYNDTLVNES